MHTQTVLTNVCSIDKSLNGRYWLLASLNGSSTACDAFLALLAGLPEAFNMLLCNPTQHVNASFDLHRNSIQVM